MWFLTCDGDLFGGRRVWLRPGSTHLLGRTSGRSEAGERIQYIDHKSVSRKHLIIRVESVKPRDSARLYTRSQISVQDGSKLGTTINGKKIVQETSLLEGKEHKIRLGSYQHEFQLRWTPIVLSFTHLGKKASKEDDPLEAQRRQLEQTDIKLVTTYVTNETTHAIAKKRNTPSALQALAQARWLVTDAFVAAITTAAHKEDCETSLLEQNFDDNWPSEGRFIVPAGSEPVPRPDELLKPNTERAEVFRGYVFVFLNESQYDLLLSAITTAGGKALLWPVRFGQSKPDEFIKYMKEVAGFKGSELLSQSLAGCDGGSIVVRLNGGPEGWKEFMRDVDIGLDQRSIEQNEFLDAILTLNPRPLKRRLQVFEDRPSQDRSAKAPTTPSTSQSEPREQQEPQHMALRDSSAISRHTNQDVEIRQDQEEVRSPESQATRLNEPEESSTAVKRRVRRTVTKSRFQGFDDFDPNQIAEPAPNSPDHPYESVESHEVVHDVEEHHASSTLNIQTESRKRSAPEPDIEEAAMYDQMLTGVAAMKRRKLEATSNGEKNALVTDDPHEGVVSNMTSMRNKKKSNEMNVLAEVQKRRAAEEEKRRKDEEALHEGLDGIDLNELKNLAQVVEMEIPVRHRTARQVNRNEISERWDPAWNGRRNFKKFRIRGQRNDVQKLRPVLVTLEEVSSRAKGAGDEYWLTPASCSGHSSGRTMSQIPSHPDEEPSDSGQEDVNLQLFQRGLESSRREDAEIAIANDIIPEEIAGQARDSTFGSNRSTTSQFKAINKRPAPSRAAMPASKRLRDDQQDTPDRLVATSRDNNNDDGELKFRRKRK